MTRTEATQSYIRLVNAAREFKDLLGVDILDCLECAEETPPNTPRLEIKVDRLVEIIAAIENEWSTPGPNIPEYTKPCPVVQLSAYRPHRS